MDKLYIPAKLKVGFNNRKDTYTGKLAYVIYQDEKGKWRKETSWENWKDDKIETEFIDNEPISGFVINKGVGGARASYGWNARNEYIRVYDPRGFEFEISVPNLLFILQETSSLKGKGLEGEFVYSWSGKELVLLPTSSKDYEESMTYTKNQAKKVYAKDLKKAHFYKAKDNEDYLYIDRLDYYRKSEWKDDRKKGEIIHEKGHIFYHMKSNNFLLIKNMNKLAYENGKIDAIAYADIHEEYMQSIHGSAPAQIELVKEDFNFTKKTNLRIFTVDELIQALAELHCKAEYWDKASTKIGLNRIFSYQGFTIEDIENDIVCLAKQKEDEKTLSEIKTFISVLESKISEETKIKNEVDEISKYFESLEQKLK